jgi:hypothetical protein
MSIHLNTHHFTCNLNNRIRPDMECFRNRTIDRCFVVGVPCVPGDETEDLFGLLPNLSQFA